MDNLDMIFLGCFSSFYCHVYLGLRAVQCDVLGIKVPFKFSLCQSEWQDADHGLICSALLGISKILPPLELPLVFVFVLFLFFFFFPCCTLLHFPALDLDMDSQCCSSFMFKGRPLTE